MESPIYLIKSRSGETLIQGTAEQIAAWKKERRVNDKDELKRQGWLLYENDEAWSVIEAFPEISGPSAHAFICKKRKHNLWLFAGACSVALLGFILILVNQLMPAYDASRRIQASADSEAKAVGVAREAVLSKQKAESAASAALAQAEAEKELARKVMDELQQQVKRTGEAKAEASLLSAKLEEIKLTMPVAIRWRESLLNNDQVVCITNTSGMPLKLLASVYNAAGVQTRNQYSLTLEPAGLPGSTKESGVGESVKYYFKQGESLELTDVDDAKNYRFKAIRKTCP